LPEYLINRLVHQRKFTVIAHSMPSSFKTYALLLFALVITSQFADAQSTSSWKEDSTAIRTEHVQLNFGTEQLKSAENIVQVKGGVKAADSSKRAVLMSNEIAVPVDRIEPFLAVGSQLVFGESPTKFKDIRIDLRSAVNAGQWTKWSVIDKDDHLTTSRDTLVGGLQYLSKDTNFLQFRIVLPSSSGVQQFRLRSIDLSFTSPGATATDKLQKIHQKSEGHPKPGEQAKEDYPMPEYVSRTDWDCPDGQQPSGPVSLTDVTHQIVHHSAGTNTSSDWPAVVRSIWDYHVNTNGWSDIGYNWLVDPNGVIYQGRGWINGDDEVMGAHFCGTNSNTMDVCMMGNFEQTRPTTDTQSSLEELLAWKSDEKNIDPTARDYHSWSGLNLFTISGHRDGCSTLCPGENLYIRLPEIRENVEQKVGEQTEQSEISTGFMLQDNYPNPFSEETNITFSIDHPGNVRITVWDTSGRMVHELTDHYYEAGTHSETWRAAGYASGIYFCRVQFGDESDVQQMVLVK